MSSLILFLHFVMLDFLFYAVYTTSTFSSYQIYKDDFKGYSTFKCRHTAYAYGLKLMPNSGLPDSPFPHSLPWLKVISTLHEWKLGSFLQCAGHAYLYNDVNSSYSVKSDFNLKGIWAGCCGVWCKMRKIVGGYDTRRASLLSPIRLSPSSRLTDLTFSISSLTI